MRAHARILGPLLLAVSLSWACSRKAPASTDIVGQWIERESSPSRAGAIACATINFTEDGRFSATNLPEEYFILMGFPATPRVDAAGSWELTTWEGKPVIDLFFEPNPLSRYPEGYNSQLLIMRDGGDFVLYQWKRDESERITFAKHDEADCASK